ISRAMDSARMRCAAFVGAKPAKLALPRIEDVFPVTRIAPLPRLIMSGVTSRARYNKPITLTAKLPFSIFGSISRKLPQPPPTALWIRTSAAPKRCLMSLTTVCTCHSSETSQVIACTSGSSSASRLISSAERASAMIRNPPAENRLTMAAPVPGPTPVTIAIGFSGIRLFLLAIVSYEFARTPPDRRRPRAGIPRLNEPRHVLVVGRARDRIAVAALGEQVDARHVDQSLSVRLGICLTAAVRRRQLPAPHGIVDLAAHDKTADHRFDGDPIVVRAQLAQIARFDRYCAVRIVAAPCGIAKDLIGSTCGDRRPPA